MVDATAAKVARSEYLASVKKGGIMSNVIKFVLYFAKLKVTRENFAPSSVVLCTSVLSICIRFPL